MDRLRDGLTALATRATTPGAFFHDACNGWFDSDMLSDEGNRFTQAYFSGDFRLFSDDFLGGVEIDTTYISAADSWENYAILSPCFDLRLAQWRRGEHPCPLTHPSQSALSQFTLPFDDGEVATYRWAATQGNASEAGARIANGPGGWWFSLDDVRLPNDGIVCPDVVRPDHTGWRAAPGGAGTSAVEKAAPAACRYRSGLDLRDCLAVERDARPREQARALRTPRRGPLLAAGSHGANPRGAPPGSGEPGLGERRHL